MDAQRQSNKSHSYWSKSGGIAKGFRPEFGSNPKQSEKMWKLMSTYKQNDKETIQHDIVNHVEYTLAKTRFDFTSFHCYQAVALSVRDRLIEAFNDTAEFYIHNDVKFLYYLSLEFLVGRFLQNALVNLELQDSFKEALEEMGFNLEKIYEEEYDAALGNGGLGRLAACFLDSFATLNLPAWGYGIRYNYGIFKQFIRDGCQCEAPDFWLDKGNPWEIERLDLNYPIRFYGHVRRTREHNKDLHFWEGGQIVIARGYDNPIPGYNTFNTINLRLWRSLPNNEFDFGSFNQGDYFRALEERQRAEYITSVLYPNDSTYAGKELRLKQQYLLVAASILDAIRRFMMKKNRDWKDWPEKVMCQLNDTHPAMAIVELLRILLDVEQFDIETAWELTYKSFGYTNHTVLPEALEKWGVDLIGNLLPRHLELIYCINQRFMDSVAYRYPYDASKLQRMSIIEEGHNQKVRMANLCIVGARYVNGVAELHSEILKQTLFKDFFDMKPNKFLNKTNGVTPRRWLKCCNPELANWLDKWTGCDDWILDMDKLKKFTKIADDPKAQAEFNTIKRNNKQKLINLVKGACNGVELILDSIFDIQVKRIHEYKRQLLNILYIIYRYICILKTPWQEREKVWQPRSCLIGGKAAPGYLTAKRIIKLANSVAEKINNDHTVSKLLKCVFFPNYNVSSAQIIIPAAEISQHISTAGLEASGTSNMKFVMNGCLLFGTMDGANVEICQEVGEENEFIFGARVHEIDGYRDRMRNMNADDYVGGPLAEVLNAIQDGMFGWKEELGQLIDTIRHNNDFYLVCHDFYHYVETQARCDQVYKTQKNEWSKKAILNVLRSGKFSSDRTINEYAKEIWGIKPCPIPDPSSTEKDRIKSIFQTNNEMKF